MPPVRPLFASLVCLLGFALATSCSVNDNSNESGGECVFGPTCVTPGDDAGKSNSAQVDAAALGPEAMDTSGLALCGEGQCLPDDANSCASFGLVDGGLDGGDAALAPHQVPMTEPDAAAVDAGDSGAQPAAQPTDAGSSADESETIYACQVTAPGSVPLPRCLPAGIGAAGDACEEVTDCAAGLACVNEAGAGRCLPYCCTGVGACEAGSYCAPRSLRTVQGNARSVPVCVPAEQCELDEPFPCAGDACSCATGKACTVVRDDGTTGCISPGRGEATERCPCAAGYFCAPASGTCLQFCSTSGQAPCASGRCQMTAGFPEGWGLCVGGGATSP